MKEQLEGFWSSVKVGMSFDYSVRKDDDKDPVPGVNVPMGGGTNQQQQNPSPRATAPSSFQFVLNSMFSSCTTGQSGIPGGATTGGAGGVHHPHQHHFHHHHHHHHPNDDGGEEEGFDHDGRRHQRRGRSRTRRI